MGTVQDLGTNIAIRCWDGDEMEYQTFLRKELYDLIFDGLDCQQLANRIGAIQDTELERLYKRLKSEMEAYYYEENS